MILCYLDTNEKNISLAKQRQTVEDYIAQHPDAVIDIFIKNQDISTLSQSLTSKENTVIVANIVCFGASLREIRDNIACLTNNRSTIISVAENFVIYPDKTADCFIKGLDYAIAIRKSLSSIVTKKALAERKAAGVVLGRRTPNRTRVFDNKEEYIKRELAKGVTKVQIAKDLGVSQGYLYAFLKAHPELKGAKNA